MNINVCPSTLHTGFDTYSSVALKRLFNGKAVSPFLDFSLSGNTVDEQIMHNVGRLSISGAQEKFSAIVENGTIRLSRDNERSTHILKPAPLDFDLIARVYIPANEHLTMQIASQVYGIITAENALCFDKRGQAVYITRRFDILPDGSKLPIEDFASIIGRDGNTGGKHYKYEGCYEDIAVAIKRYVAAWPVALERFYRLVIFNYIYGNGDAHLKNFSLQRVGNEYMLTPAYDLLNTAMHIHGDDLGLQGGLLRSGWKSDKFIHTGHPVAKDFERFGLEIGIPQRRVEAIISEFKSLPEMVTTLISNSFLDNKNKRNYLRIVRERISRFLRDSE